MSEISTIVGSVASVLTSALPLLLSAFTDEEGGAEVGSNISSIDIGPGTMYRLNNKTYYGNFAEDESDDKPIYVSFSDTTPEGTITESTMLAVDDAIEVTDQLRAYASGECTVCGDGGAPVALRSDELDRIPDRVGDSYVWKAIQWATGLYCPTGTQSIIPVAGPSTSNTTITINIQGGALVIAAGFGLGLAYIFTSRNSNGEQGYRSGSMRQRRTSADDRSGVSDAQPFVYEADLPENVSFKDGLYGYSITLQIPAPADSASRSTNADAVIVTVPPEVRAKMVRVSRH